MFAERVSLISMFIILGMLQLFRLNFGVDNFTPGRSTFDGFSFVYPGFSFNWFLFRLFHHVEKQGLRFNKGLFRAFLS